MDDDVNVRRMRNAVQQRELAVQRRAAWVQKLGQMTVDERVACEQTESPGALFVTQEERPRTPPIWKAARWYGATPFFDSGARGIAFDLEDGSIVRLVLSADHLLTLSELCDPNLELRGYLQGFQSDSSSGNPSVDGSTPPAGQVV